MFGYDSQRTTLKALGEDPNVEKNALKGSVQHQDVEAITGARLEPSLPVRHTPDISLTTLRIS